MSERAHGAAIIDFTARQAPAKVLNVIRPTSQYVAHQQFRSPMPILPLHVYDVDGSGLSPVTSGMYWRLLACVWVDEAILDDPTQLARAVGTTRAQWTKRAPELAPSCCWTGSVPGSAGMVPPSCPARSGPIPTEIFPLDPERRWTRLGLLAGRARVIGRRRNDQAIGGTRSTA